MARQLIFTSVPSGLDAGRSGYCTVARHGDIRERILPLIERFSTYHHQNLSVNGNSLNPVIYSHHILSVGDARYHILTRIVDARLDYSRRSNYLAHHLILETSELEDAPTPAAIFLTWDGWLNEWPETEAPRYLSPDEQVSLSTLHPRVPAPFPANTWRELAGDPACAALLPELPPGKRALLIAKPGTEKKLLNLYHESFSLLPAAKQWEIPFTTFAQQTDNTNDFLWFGAWEGLLPAKNTGHLLFDLTRPGTIPPPKSELARRASLSPAEYQSRQHNPLLAIGRAFPDPTQPDVSDEKKPFHAPSRSLSRSTLPTIRQFSNTIESQIPPSRNIFGFLKSHPILLAVNIVIIIALLIGIGFLLSSPQTTGQPEPGTTIAADSPPNTDKVPEKNEEKTKTMPEVRETSKGGDVKNVPKKKPNPSPAPAPAPSPSAKAQQEKKKLFDVPTYYALEREHSIITIPLEIMKEMGRGKKRITLTTAQDKEIATLDYRQEEGMSTWKNDEFSLTLRDNSNVRFFGPEKDFNEIKYIKIKEGGQILIGTDEPSDSPTIALVNDKKEWSLDLKSSGLENLKEISNFFLVTKPNGKLLPYLPENEIGIKGTLKDYWKIPFKKQKESQSKDEKYTVNPIEIIQKQIVKLNEESSPIKEEKEKLVTDIGKIGEEIRENYKQYSTKIFDIQELLKADKSFEEFISEKIKVYNRLIFPFFVPPDSLSDKDKIVATIQEISKDWPEEKKVYEKLKKNIKNLRDALTQLQKLYEDESLVQKIQTRLSERNEKRKEALSKEKQIAEINNKIKDLEKHKKDFQNTKQPFYLYVEPQGISPGTLFFVAKTAPPEPKPGPQK